MDEIHKLAIEEGFRSGKINGKKQGPLAFKHVMEMLPLYPVKNLKQVSNYVSKERLKKDPLITESVDEKRVAEFISRIQADWKNKFGFDELLVKRLRLPDIIKHPDDPSKRMAATVIVVASADRLAMLEHAKVWFTDGTQGISGRGHHVLSISIIDSKASIYPIGYMISPGETIRLIQNFLILIAETFMESFPGRELHVRIVMADGLPGLTIAIKGMMYHFKDTNLFVASEILRFMCNVHMWRNVLGKYGIKTSGVCSLVYQLVTLLSSSPNEFMVISLFISIAKLFFEIEKIQPAFKGSQVVFYLLNAYILHKETGNFYSGAAQEKVGGLANLLCRLSNNTSESENNIIKGTLGFMHEFECL